MARKPLQFRNLPKDAHSAKLAELLGMMKEIKDSINDEVIEILSAVEPSVRETKRAVHSYKLDFETGQVELKIALVDKPKDKAVAGPAVSLKDWLAGMAQKGR